MTTSSMPGTVDTFTTPTTGWAGNITCKQILMYLARELREAKSEWITAAATGTYHQVITLGNSQSDANTYNYGLAEIPGADIWKVVSFDSSHILTVDATADTGAAAGERVALAWWKANNFDNALQAIQEAIRESYEAGWYREMIVDDAAATITLASGTDSYNLPADVTRLSRVGIEPDATSGIIWFAQENIWRDEGQEGAKTIRFYRMPQGTTFPDNHDGSKLCLWYEAREPVPTNEDATGIALPTEYFRYAKYLYRLNMLNAPSDTEMRQANLGLPQFFRTAQEACAALRLVKPRLPVGPVLRLDV